MTAYPLRATRWVAGTALLAATAIPAAAVTCDDVRSLTRAEQVYWAKKLNLSADQRRRIYQACYGQPRITETKSADSTSTRSER